MLHFNILFFMEKSRSLNLRTRFWCFALLTASYGLMGCGLHHTESFGETSTGGVTRVEKSTDPIELAAAAIRSGDLKELSKLFGEGLSVDTYLSNKRTLLIEAIAWEKIEVIQFLLSRNAQIDLTDAEGKSALEHAAGKPAILRLLNPQEAAEKLKLFEAIENNKFNEVKALLNQGVNPNQHFDDGESPLTLAVRKGFENVVRVLLQQLLTDVNFRNAANESPLSIAKQLQFKRIQDLLIRRGAKEF